MEFTVDLTPDEYRQAMLWRQYASTPGRRLNDWVSWAILFLTPLTVILFWMVAPEALSVWFWLVAVMALSYAFYAAVLVRRRIQQEAASLAETHPALAATHYRLSSHTLWLHHGEDELKLRWRDLVQAQELNALFLLFFSAEETLLVPKRCIPDLNRFRALVAGEPGRTNSE